MTHTGARSKTKIIVIIKIVDKYPSFYRPPDFFNAFNNMSGKQSNIQLKIKKFYCNEIYRHFSKDIHVYLYS